MKSIFIFPIMFLSVFFISNDSISKNQKILEEDCMGPCSTVCEIFVDNLYDEMGQQAFDIANYYFEDYMLRCLGLD